VSVTIAEVRPNGTVLVKGEKRLTLSQGQEWVQLSGIVRLADIDTTNRVQSGQVADARSPMPATAMSAAPPARAG
jgi:flagellar L-ring protein precursor FlgH